MVLFDPSKLKQGDPLTNYFWLQIENMPYTRKRIKSFDFRSFIYKKEYYAAKDLKEAIACPIKSKKEDIMKPLNQMKHLFFFRIKK